MIEINLHPGSVAVPDDQYHVERVALADCNFNLACETGISYTSLVAMLKRRAMLWRALVIFDGYNKSTDQFYCIEHAEQNPIQTYNPDFIMGTHYQI
jgi:hypothetical protein